MSVILSSLNLKGGVGKTTISVNYAAYCAKKGRRTLLIDLDPQTNATFGLIGVGAWEKHIKTKGTVADLLGARRHKSADGKGRPFAECVIKNAWDGVDLLPSHLDLYTVDLDLSGLTAREYQLRKSLKDHMEDYDVIICDCPPNLTLPTQNALAMSSAYVIPVSLDFLSVLGIGILLGRIDDLTNDLDVEIENAGIILSRVGRPARHRAETEATVRGQFSDHILTGKIKDRSAVSKAMEQTHSIFDSKNADAIAEFNYVFAELDAKLGLS